jgi:hypothetical protein
MCSLRLRALPVIAAQAAIQYPVCELQTSACIDLPPQTKGLQAVLPVPQQALDKDLQAQFRYVRSLQAEHSLLLKT